ncbi:MAG: extracellular solute-binding protein [Anaerolineales bacterium]
MIEIEMSCIPDAEVDFQTLSELAAQFERQSGVRVHLYRMTWGTAWAEFVTIASHGKGPDLSHLGGSWVSSLATMNALRAFHPPEIEAMGGAQAFSPPTWASTRLVGDERIWALPWTGYVYLVCYHRDLLQGAGLDPAQAFGSRRALTATTEQLRQAGLESPVVIPYVPPPYTDLVHMAASCIWSAGGEFVDEEGRQVLLDLPPALDGLTDWLNFYRLVPPAYVHLTQEECLNLFLQRRAAVLVIDNRFIATNLIRGQGLVKGLETVAFAPLTETPWFGGGDFVIWQHTQGYPDRERAAVEFIQFLVSKEAQLMWAERVGSMPARLEALHQAYPAGHPLQAAVLQAVQQGRDYLNVPLWRRLEFQIAQTLGALLQEAHENRGTPARFLIERRILPLVERLNLTLRG